MLDSKIQKFKDSRISFAELPLVSSKIYKIQGLAWPKEVEKPLVDVLSL